MSSLFIFQVHIINLLQDSKFQHFKPVMDTYIESHFAGALSYRYATFQPPLLKDVAVTCAAPRVSHDAAVPAHYILMTSGITRHRTFREAVLRGSSCSALCHERVNRSVNEMLVVPPG